MTQRDGRRRRGALGISWGGASALGGGGLLAAVAALMATRPVGAPGHVRETDDLWPFATGALLLVAAGALATFGGRRGTGTLGATGLWVLATGALLTPGLQLAAAGGADVPWTATFASLLGVLVGSALLAGAALRAGVVPRSAAAALLGASLLPLGFNTEDARAWLAVPFGLAWALVGLLVARPPRGLSDLDASRGRSPAQRGGGE